MVEVMPDWAQVSDWQADIKKQAATRREADEIKFMVRLLVLQNT